MKYVTAMAMILVLTGCSASNSSESEEATVLVDDELSHFSMSEADGFDEINTDFFIDTEEEEKLAIAHDLLLSAEQREGIVDMTTPDYHIVAVQNNGIETEIFAWWKDEYPEELVFMNREDTHATFMVDSEIAQQFEELIK